MSQEDTEVFCGTCKHKTLLPRDYGYLCKHPRTITTEKDFNGSTKLAPYCRHKNRFNNCDDYERDSSIWILKAIVSIIFIALLVAIFYTTHE